MQACASIPNGLSGAGAYVVWRDGSGGGMICAGVLVSGVPDIRHDGRFSLQNNPGMERLAMDQQQHLIWSP